MYAYQKEEVKQSELQTEEDPEEQTESTEPEPSMIRREDGTYCWKGKMDLRRDNWILTFLLKAILIPSGILFALFIIFAMRERLSVHNILMAYGILLGTLGVVALIIWLCSFLTAWAMEFKMILPYEMNEKGIALVQGNDRSLSEFKGVRTVRLDPEKHRIYLNSWFLYNVICCDETNYDFVEEYIVSRCTHAKVFWS